MTVGKHARVSRARTIEPHKVLFIDFDGVLHPSVLSRFDGPPAPHIGTELFGWLPALAGALRSHPDVAVVVHSIWRYTHDLDGLHDLLGALGNRVIGTTPRGAPLESVLGWLDMNPRFASYRILGADPTDFPIPLPSELILCDPRAGVSAPAVLAAIRQLLEE